MKGSRLAMTMDTRRCVGCQACVIACKTENALPNGSYRDWVEQETRGAFPTLTMENRSVRCNHCDHPPCVGRCPTGASHVNAGGAVIVTHRKCTGCKACITACPYDARYVHPEGWVDKCTFCLHRVGRGELPACVGVCPTRSLTFGDLADPDSDVSRQLSSRKHRTAKPETGIGPNLYFLT